MDDVEEKKEEAPKLKGSLTKHERKIEKRIEKVHMENILLQNRPA